MPFGLHDQSADGIHVDNISSCASARLIAHKLVPVLMDAGDGTALLPQQDHQQSCWEDVSSRRHMTGEHSADGVASSVQLLYVVVSFVHRPGEVDAMWAQEKFVFRSSVRHCHN